MRNLCGVIVWFYFNLFFFFFCFLVSDFLVVLQFLRFLFSFFFLAFVVIFSVNISKEDLVSRYFFMVFQYLFFFFFFINKIFYEHNKYLFSFSLITIISAIFPWKWYNVDEYKAFSYCDCCFWYFFFVNPFVRGREHLQSMHTRMRLFLTGML